jgi:hypothetical protein
MGARDADIIETGPPRTPARSHRLTAVAVAVVIAGTAGYAVGSRRTATPPTPVPTASALPAGAPAVVTTGGRCWAQPGAQLQLGLEVVNRSGSAATLRRLEPVLPLGGLRPTASAWGGCGQLPPVPAGDLTLAAGATTWLTMTFDVLDRCPAPFPVGFTLTYTQAGRPAVADLRGFPDLGDVPYTGGRCPRPL